MKTISEIKKIQELKHTELFNKVGLFWAFSNQQFEENKTPLKEGEKYVSIGAGGYIPKSNIDLFTQGMKDIKNWHREEVNKNKAEEKEIIYELYNHECFYINDCTEVIEIFTGIYTKDQILNTYKKEYKNAYKD